MGKIQRQAKGPTEASFDSGNSRAVAKEQGPTAVSGYQLLHRQCLMRQLLLLVFKRPHPCSAEEQLKPQGQLREVRIYYGEKVEGTAAYEEWGFSHLLRGKAGAL